MPIDYQKLREQLKAREGLTLYAYRDSKGYWTIGYGRCVDARVGGGITETEAAALLSSDTLRTLTDLDKAIPWWQTLDDVRSRVLVDMAFNMGMGQLWEFHKMLAHVQRGEYAEAADDMLDSNYARHDVPARAAENARWMRTGSSVAVDQ
jgi:lysozyme